MLKSLRRTIALVAIGVGLVVVVLGSLTVYERWRAGRFREEALTRVPLRATQTGSLPRSLRESSGVAASRSQPDLLWTHNDSGGDPVLFAVDLTGEILAEYEIEDARVRDWEDVALGPCPDLIGDCLYIAETGDNRERRSRYRVYVVREPIVPRDGDRVEVKTELVGRTIFEYPDTAHDAEALAVAPDGEVLIVTKGRSGTVDVFSLGRLQLADRDARPTARQLATLPIDPWWQVGRVVTGAAFSRDGSVLAVRTYTEVFFFSRTPSGDFRLVGPPCFVGDLARGGEAVDFLDDSAALVLTSERTAGADGAIHVVTCRH